MILNRFGGIDPEVCFFQNQGCHTASEQNKTGCKSHSVFYRLKVAIGIVNWRIVQAATDSVGRCSVEQAYFLIQEIDTGFQRMMGAKSGIIKSEFHSGTLFN